MKRLEVLNKWDANENKTRKNVILKYAPIHPAPKFEIGIKNCGMYQKFTLRNSKSDLVSASRIMIEKELATMEESRGFFKVVEENSSRYMKSADKCL